MSLTYPTLKKSSYVDIWDNSKSISEENYEVPQLSPGSGPFFHYWYYST